MVGPDAPEIIQGVGIAVKAGLTKAQFDATVGIHPTMAEEFVTLREKFRAPSLVAPANAGAQVRRQPRDLAWIPPRIEVLRGDDAG